MRGWVGGVQFGEKRGSLASEELIYLISFKIRKRQPPNSRGLKEERLQEVIEDLISSKFSSR